MSYKLLKVIEDELSKRGMGLIFSIYKEDEDLPPMIRQRQVDGVFVTGRVTHEIIEKVKAANVPFVLLGKMSDKECRVNKVETDVKSDVISVYNYLIEHGHKEIAYISDYREKLLINEVTSGCKFAYESHGLEPRVDLLRFNVEEPYDVISEFITEHPEITALIIQNVFADTFSHIAKERGLDIPSKISVIVYNDEYLDVKQRNYFTYIPSGIEKIGVEGVKGLIDLSSGKVSEVDLIISNEIKPGKTIKNL
jgi:DNA-binding LacI/PurR family transcriptional regulator